MRRTKDQCSESVVSGQIKQLTEQWWLCKSESTFLWHVCLRIVMYASTSGKSHGHVISCGVGLRRQDLAAERAWSKASCWMLSTQSRSKGREEIKRWEEESCHFRCSCLTMKESAGMWRRLCDVKLVGVTSAVCLHKQTPALANLNDWVVVQHDGFLLRHCAEIDFGNLAAFMPTFDATLSGRSECRPEAASCRESWSSHSGLKHILPEVSAIAILLKYCLLGENIQCDIVRVDVWLSRFFTPHPTMRSGYLWLLIRRRSSDNRQHVSLVGSQQLHAVGRLLAFLCLSRTTVSDAEAAHLMCLTIYYILVWHHSLVVHLVPRT